MSFTLNEAAALLLGEKLLVSSLDVDQLQDFKQALNKIRAVISNTDKDYLSSLDTDFEVLPTGSQFPIDELQKGTEEPSSLNQQGAPHSGDRWLRESQEVELFFGPEAARFVGEQRYMFGFIDEERQPDGVKMRFLTSMPEYMAALAAPIHG